MGLSDRRGEIMAPIVPVPAMIQTRESMTRQNTMDSKQQRLIWLDLEMTGLNPESDSILEIATIVTDAELNELAEGPVYAVRHPEPVLMAMDEWNTMPPRGCGNGWSPAGMT